MLAALQLLSLVWANCEATAPLQVNILSVALVTKAVNWQDLAEGIANLAREQTSPQLNRALALRCVKCESSGLLSFSQKQHNTPFQQVLPASARISRTALELGLQLAELST